MVPLSSHHVLVYILYLSYLLPFPGQRIGAVSFLTSSPEEAIKVESQLKILVRPMYSNPPKQGAKIVSTILKYSSSLGCLESASDPTHMFTCSSVTQNSQHSGVKR